MSEIDRRWPESQKRTSFTMSDRATQPTISLSIKNGGKSIPYGRGERPDGSKNHGFKPLKANPEEISAIPEAQDIAALKNALVELNSPSSPLFTVGCEKAFNRNNSGHWVNGYLEFAFNYRELIEDGQYYFKLFFYFNQWHWKLERKPSVQYNFELEGAHFLKASTGGLTMSVWIATGTFPTKESAQSAWEQGLDTVVAFLKQQGVPADSRYTRIY